MSLAINRLTEERKSWRKDLKTADGSLSLLNWEAGIPGKKGTPWEGGVYPVSLIFSTDYPQKPPKCIQLLQSLKYIGKFLKPLFHPNVYPSGTICLSIINEDQDWKPSITMKQILLGIQDLLDEPNPGSPAQEPAYQLFVKDLEAYKVRILGQAKEYIPKDV